jgi:hypothetical protein
VDGLKASRLFFSIAADSTMKNVNYRCKYRRLFIYLFIYQFVGRDGAVGIATRYWLDSPRIESRWRDIFRTRPDRPWDPGVKRSERGVNHPSASSTVVKEIVELYVYFPLCVDGTLCGEIYFLTYYLYSAR